MVYSYLIRTAYAVAVLGTLLAIVIRVAIGDRMGSDASLVLFGIPVAIATWLGGLRPGVIATTLASLGAVYFLTGTWDASHLVDISNQIRVISFVALGIVASYAGESLQGFRRKQELEHQAQTMRRQWETILGGIPTPFYILDENWRFTFVSDRLLEITGLDREAFLGKLAWEVLDDSAGYSIESKLRESQSRQTLVTFDSHDAVNGRWFENHIYPFSTGVAVLVADISERKRAEEALRVSEMRFRTLATNAPVAIFIKDLEGRYTLANPLACEALGRPEGMNGLTDHDLMPKELADIIRTHDLEVLSTGEAIEREEEVVGPLGNQLFLAVKFPLVGALGQTIGVCGVSMNITARKSAEETDALLAAIVASSDDAIISKSLDGTILSWNARAERLFGYSAGEAIGSSIMMIIPEDRADEEAEILARLKRGERIEHYETVRVSKRGRLIDVSLTASLFRDGSGRIVGASSILRNITERKQSENLLRQSEEQFHLLADSIPQLAWMTRSDGHVVWYNKRWYEFTGATARQMHEEGWQHWVDPEAVPRVVESWKAALAEQRPWEDTFAIRRHDGELCWHLARAIPLKDKSGNVTRWFGTNTDITPQRRMEEALRDADRRKDEFLATLAHELRNPLAPIRSSLQILRLSGTADPALRRVQEVMERQVDHLVRLVDDLLDVSRITRGKIQLQTERVEIATIVRNAVEVSRPFIDANNHQLSITLPPDPILIEADTVRMAQVLSNLLNNAAKFMPEGGQISISACQQGDEVLLSVGDSGPGMEAGLVHRVFDLFTQGEQLPGRAHGGLGIGLTLVKSLTELHGGTVEARSEGPGRGSEFIVRLPLTSSTGAESQTTDETPQRMLSSSPPDDTLPRSYMVDGANHQASPASEPRIPSPVLIVDDYQDAASALAMLIRAIGAQVHLAYSGEEALITIEKQRPRVVLLDIGMPGMDGYEVARRIRRQSINDDIILIALTGWGQEDDRRRSREAGFDHHLLKPVDFRALEELLESLASSSKRSAGFS